jgi:transcriptional regulator with PAS, ATPase and Fis domain
MITINTIIDTVKEFAEATKSAFKMDVMVVDEKKKIIIATGELSGVEGNFIVESGIINKEIFTNRKKSFIISDTINDHICIRCDKYKKTCIYKNVVATGIYDGDILRGVLSLNAVTESQVNFMSNNEQNILNFLNRISSLLNSKILEEKTISELKKNSDFLNSIYNVINKGVIVINSNNKIIKINEFMIQLMSLGNKSILGKDINDIFTNISNSDISDSEISLHNEVSIKINGETKFFIYTSTPLMLDFKTEAKAYFFDDTKEINDITYKSFNKSDFVTLNNIIGENETFIEFKQTIKKVAKTDSTIMLCGETGTGKELFARSIHSESPRSSEPFIAINCGAIPETLIESELFGYEKGAFTGANLKGKHGKFYLADKGTIFLDEVETMPLYLQQKLLRVIERKEIERIGSSECISIDVRIVSATNVRLDEMVKGGQFREDLYHRLNVIGLYIPPLRERGNDVLVLADYFINKFNKRFNKNIIGIDENTKKLFLKYKWSGNIRELQNTVEYAINMENSNYIRIENLPLNFQDMFDKVTIENINTNNCDFLTLNEIEKNFILKALDYYGHSDKGIVDSAKALGISRSTIYRKIAKYDL